MKIRAVGAMQTDRQIDRQTDRQTDTTKLTFTFRNFANGPITRFRGPKPQKCLQM